MDEKIEANIENNKRKGKTIIISLILLILIACAAYVLCFIPLKTITINNTNFEKYFTEKIEVKNYVPGKPLNYILGISNYSASTAEYNVTIKPKNENIECEDIKIKYQIDHYLWGSFHENIAKLDENGYGEINIKLESVSMQLNPVEKPLISDLSKTKVSGIIKQPIINIG